ncbi:MAG: thioesterase family protein [Gammaproteobacteria bacterium]|nr:MAG: thioesterase family protein [Gammaproteobacteria bacterium]
MATPSPPTDSIFTRDGAAWVPTSAAMGPWGDTLHGGAPAALICHLLEEAAGGALQLARLSMDLFRPVPALPLEVSVRSLRKGRRLAVHEAVLSGGGKELVRATSLHTAAMAVSAEANAAVCPLPPESTLTETSLADVVRAQSGRALPGRDGLHLRLMVRRDSGLDGGGAGGGWLRLPLDLAPGLPLAPMVHLAALADFANGVSQRRLEEPEGRIGFINADISLHVLRPPAAGAVGLVSRNQHSAEGRGLVSAECWQADGLIARVVQSVLAQPAA